MIRIRKLIFALLISLPGLAWSSDSTKLPNWCRTQPWPHSRDLGIGAILGAAEQSEKIEILQMVWYDLVNRPEKTVAPPLIAYLSHNETDKPFREFLKAHLFYGFQIFSVEPVVRSWPERPAYANELVELRDLCRGFIRAGGERLLFPQESLRTSRLPARR